MLEFREIPTLWKCPFPSTSVCGEPGSWAPCLQMLSKMVRLKCGSVPWCRELTGCVLGTGIYMLGESVSLSLNVLPQMGPLLCEHWLLPSCQASGSISHSHFWEGLQQSSPGPDKASVSLSVSPGPSAFLTWCFPLAFPKYLRALTQISLLLFLLLLFSCQDMSESLQLHGL